MKLPTPLTLFHRIRSRCVKRWCYYLLMNAYLPHFGAGIRFTYIAPDLMTIRTKMRLHWWNRNFVGTQFGGSLYAMCDASYMILLLEAMGDQFVVWDKAATIHFRRPGRGTVRVEFRITPEKITALRETLAHKEKHDEIFPVQVIDDAGTVVAEVEKVVHFRHKTSLTTA